MTQASGADTSGQYDTMTTGQWKAVLDEPEAKSKKVFAQTLEALRELNQKMDELLKVREGQ